jgi:hypothetical protein
MYLNKRCRNLVIIIRSRKSPLCNLFEDVNKTNNQILVCIWFFQDQVIEGAQGCTHHARIFVTEPLHDKTHHYSEPQTVLCAAVKHKRSYSSLHKITKESKD